jgi:hypothetical protein
MEWPIDILVQFLYALDAQCNSFAQRTWNKLAFLTCKQDALASAANSMNRPMILRIDADPRLQYHEGMVFKIPFHQATVVCIDVDWGDGCVDKIREKVDGYAQHTYASPGEYHVRVYPASAKVSLDHLGFEDYPEGAELWWRPLKEIVSLGKVGLRSLSYLFAYSDSNPAPVGSAICPACSVRPLSSIGLSVTGTSATLRLWRACFPLLCHSISQSATGMSAMWRICARCSFML